MGKLKLSRLLYSLMKSFPKLSISRRQSKYEVDFVVFKLTWVDEV